MIKNHRKAILVGYEPNGYKIWDCSNENFLVASDVIFVEINNLVSRPEMRLEGIEFEKLMKEKLIYSILNQNK